MADAPKVYPPWKPKKEPWHPLDYDDRVIYAARAFEQGTASMPQQRILWRWLMYATGADEMAYRPGGTDGERDTGFALGRQFVGHSLKKMLHPELTPPEAPEPATNRKQKR